MSDAIHRHSPDQFSEERETLNELVLAKAGTSIKRFWNLDAAVYREGTLPAGTKHLLGLVASLVLRCDDCIQYHQIEAYKAGISDEEFEETMSIGLLVGGSITIPHIRHAFAFWEELKTRKEKP